MKQKFIEERVNELENEVKTLKLIVEQLRKPSTVVQEEIDKVEWLRGEIEGVIEFEGQHYKKVDREACGGDVVIYPKLHESWHGDITANKAYIAYEVDKEIMCKDDAGDLMNVYGERKGYDDIGSVMVYELIKQDVQHQTVPCAAARPAREFLAELISEKSPNQLRAEIIEKAKGFVDKYFKACRSKLALLEGNGLLKKWDMSPKFEVNPEKRAVVALLYRTNGGALVGKGIAKCNPSDVFNSHIGKAIALGRALGLDVSEFEQAVQPNEFVKGQVVKVNESDGKIHVEGELVGVESQRTLNFSGDSYRKYIGRTCLRTSLPDSWEAIVLNDTNAIYGGVE